MGMFDSVKYYDQYRVPTDSKSQGPPVDVFADKENLAASSLLRSSDVAAQLKYARRRWQILESTFSAKSEHDVLPTVRLLQRFIPVEVIIDGEKYICAIPTLMKGQF